MVSQSIFHALSIISLYEGRRRLFKNLNVDPTFDLRVLNHKYKHNTCLLIYLRHKTMHVSQTLPSVGIRFCPSLMVSKVSLTCWKYERGGYNCSPHD